ncbi:MAG: homocysteine S-methyltransferase family protein [Oscillospiraceae bacterium]|nr:homocysteine S-methyltransferase family protein [Oscillospiraceae bacterium]
MNDNKKLTLLDGATGTMIQAAGLKLGERPELFGMEHPDIVGKIHRAYVEAGSDIIYANTFGANAHKLAGLGHSVEEVISANIATARAAAGDRAKVALDIGPIGELMEPLGTLSFDEAYALFAEMLRAGERAGADLVVFETMTDLAEARAAVLAAKEQTSLPVWVTMSFEAGGRTFTGTTVASMAVTLGGLGADALGINCSLGPDEIFPLIQEMLAWTDKPVIVKPNAGLPDPATGAYSMDAEMFARQMSRFPALGVTIMGGCCGTTPEFIRALAALAPDENAAARPALRRGVCSASHMTELKGVRVIGERINPTGKKRFQQALRERDLNYIMERAIEQADAGADILDINVGLPGIDEAEMMTQVVRAVQSVVDLPLQIDSSDPAAIEAGLRECAGRAIVNSVNAETENLERVLPLVKKYGAAVVGLTMDKSGIPQTADERVALAERILDAAAAHGIPREDVLIDCLTLTISAQQEQAAETLRAVRTVHERLGLHCVLGVSNISFGLPTRAHVTVSFLTQAMLCGLDLPIVNPNQSEIMDAVFAFRALSGEDRDCARYIERFASAPSAPTAAPSSEMTLEAAILKGLKQETAQLTAALLETMSELEVINERLIPALDVVGEKYEKQEIFLPQLINAANAACAGFDLIKTRIASRGGESVSKGKIILATVEGDIHDIGKNIVRVVLENYGYQVLDLGRDVPVQSVVDAAVRENVSLVGLSALMTTTVDSMRRTIQALRASGHPCKVMVGGAVLTPEYAEQIGADYYARDAKASADIAKEVLG